MYKTLLVVLLSLFILGCSKDENGFYKYGLWKGKHCITKTQWSDKGINYYTGSKFDSLGYNQAGYDKNGYNKKGFNKLGYDKDGFNKKGFNKKGFHKLTHSKFNEKGYDCFGNKSAFKIKNFVDEFGDKTYRSFISQKIEGTFSNSATDYSKAYISFIYEASNYVRFDICEYNPGNKANFHQYEHYCYRLKNDKGKIVSGDMYIENIKGSLTIANDDEAFDMIKTSKQVKVYIYEVDPDLTSIKEDSEYRFNIDCAGIKTAIESLVIPPLEYFLDIKVIKFFYTSAFMIKPIPIRVNNIFGIQAANMGERIP